MTFFMDSPVSAPSRRLRRFLRGLFTSGSQTSQALYEEILYLASRTQSPDALLTLFPERIRTALELSSFHIFLRDQTNYVLQYPSTTGAARIALPASCSTVSRMRRDRRPALFIPEGTPHAEPDGWQLLATPAELEILTALDTQLLLPLEGRTGLMGFATLSRAAHRTFSAAELHFLRNLGPQMGRGLETAQLVRSLSEQAIERARAHRELELAREVQEHLLPANFPSISGLDAAAAYRSAEQVGGDYYDLFPTADGSVCTVIADVSGKGVPAALLMAALRASLHALMIQSGVPLTTLIERLNTLVYKASSANRYATLFFCIYDPATRQLAYVNAGHNPPMLLRSDQSVTRLTRGGTVVGLMPYASFECETLTLGCGDTLVAYTDGVTEAMNAEGQEWEDQGLQAAILHASFGTNPTSQQFVENILQKLDDFTAGAPQTDDITLFVLRGISLLGAKPPPSAEMQNISEPLIF